MRSALILNIINYFFSSFFFSLLINSIICGCFYSLLSFYTLLHRHLGGDRNGRSRCPLCQFAMCSCLSCECVNQYIKVPHIFQSLFTYTICTYIQAALCKGQLECAHFENNILFIHLQFTYM